MNSNFEEVVCGSVNLKLGSTIVLDAVTLPTIARLYKQLQAKPLQPIDLNISSLTIESKLFLTSKLLHIPPSPPPSSLPPLLHTLITTAQLTSLHLSPSFPSLRLSLSTYKTLSLPSLPSISPIQSLIQLLESLQIQEKQQANRLMLNIKNVGELNSYCGERGLSSKEMLKLVLFEEYSLENKTARSWGLEGCRGNIRETVEVLEYWIGEIVNREVREWETGGKEVNLYFSKEDREARFQNLKHNNLSKFLTNQIPIVKPPIQSPSPPLHLIVLPKQQRLTSKLLPLPSSRISSDYRLHKLFKHYIALSTHNTTKKRFYFNKLRSKISSYAVAEHIIKTSLLNNVFQIITVKQQRELQCNKSISTLSKYIPVVPNRVKYGNKLGIMKTTMTLEKYLQTVNPSSHYEKAFGSKVELVKRIQVRISSHLIRKKLLEQLSQQHPPEPLQDPHYPALITSFNTLLNRCNRLREVEKKAFVTLQIISVKNNTTSPLFSSPNLLEFLKDCSSKYKNDEHIQKINLTDTSLTFVTNYRRSVYGIVEGGEEPSMQLSKNQGSGYRMVLKDDGVLYAVGENRYGELGVGDYTPRDTLTQVLVPGSVSKISCGAKQSVCLTTSNQLFLWGLSKQNNKKTALPTPHHIPLPSPSEILDIESSNYNSFALLDNRQVIQLNNRIICYKQSSSTAIPFQILCIKSNTLEIVVIKKVDFSGVSLSLKRKKEILGEFKGSRVGNKEWLGRIPGVGAGCREVFCSGCVGGGMKENDDNNLLE